MAVRMLQKTKTNKADYAQYLYLASVYGPLDALLLLYCCCRPGMHGHVYMQLVDNSTRRLQCWAFTRIAALRRYWIDHVVHEVCEFFLAEGL